MRLWSLHPNYLDRQGLVALWRESLLARAVLGGRTRGYRHHPQLDRFRSHNAPLAAMSVYLEAVRAEAEARGYSFDGSKAGRVGHCAPIPLNSGQLAFEWEHLMAKLAKRSPELYDKWHSVTTPECHPLFRVRAGGIEPWERQNPRAPIFA